MKKLIDLNEEEFNGLKEIGMLWEFYPEAPSTFQETIQANPIYARIQKQEAIISEAYKEISRAKEDCAHPLFYFKFENHSRSDEWGCNTEYWKTCYCDLCGSHWGHKFNGRESLEEMHTHILENINT